MKYQYQSPPQETLVRSTDLDPALSAYLDDLIANDPLTQAEVNTRQANVLAAAKMAVQNRYIWLVVGFVVGLFVFGWWLYPVKWVDAGFEDLTPGRQVTLILSLSDLHSFQPGNINSRNLIAQWPEFPQYACALARQEPDPARVARLVYMVYQVSGVNCYDATATGQ